MKKNDLNWYAVKCLFYHPTRKKDTEAFLYEERIKLWQANSYDEAYKKAEIEAEIYASEANAVFVTPTDSFMLFDKVLNEGVEVYSIMRGSNLNEKTYRNTFCTTNRDRLH